jgi:hypothetical protein
MIHLVHPVFHVEFTLKRIASALQTEKVTLTSHIILWQKIFLKFESKRRKYKSYIF